MDNTATLIQDYINNELTKGQTVTADTDLLMTNAVDSIGVMRLVAYLEEQFSIRINPADVTINNFRSVDLIAAYVDAQKLTV